MVASMNWVERLNAEGETREEAISQLRVILVRGILKSFASRGVDNAFAEDIAQDALLRILNSLDSFEGRSRFTTWAMAIAVRTAVSELRRRHFRDVSLEQVIHGENNTLDLGETDVRSAEDSIDRQALYDQLREHIETDLTEKQKTVIQALLGGMPVENIADRMGTNRNAVYKMMHDARLKLKQSFESSGVSPEEIQSILAGGA
ncbi:MAG: sigma-70 family RNA polymerase sigma factor [Planctomicrobium sp.]|nr:sigma-70 family RNA polymerase sigma factor [Planctomicrobium sp.]